MKKILNFLKILGPGVITGAADDDPSGIATYSQAGAQFGMSAAWMNIYLIPFQVAVQEACARIGAVTGRGIAAVVKKNYPRWVLYGVVILLLVANTINIGADLGAMAEAMNILLPWDFTGYIILFTLLILVLEIFTSYKVYSKILKWLALTLVVYLMTLGIVGKGSWTTIIIQSFSLQIHYSFQYLFIFIGVVGTSISPYMFFWEAGEEVEEEKQEHLIKNGKPAIGKRFIQHLRTDNLIGMLMSAIAAWAIVVVAALVLFPNGVHDIRSATDAAKALEPLVASYPNAGFLSKLLFASGIISLGLLGVPVLSGSAAYAIAETLNMREGLNLKFKQAHGFYGAITIATLLGLVINYIGIDPMRALVYTAVINGIVAVPLLFIIFQIAGNKAIMGKFASGTVSKVLVGITIALMAVGTIGIFASFFIRQ